MTILTKPMTDLIGRTSGMVNYPKLAQQLNSITEQLNALARREGLSTAFTDGGDVIKTLPATSAGDLINNYNALREQAGTATDDRENALKALKIGAGVAIGATATTLFWREANRRGWAVRGMRAFNRAVIPALVTKNYGKLAGLAASLAMDGKICAVRSATNGKSRTSPVILTNDGLVQKQGDDAQVEIPFESIAQIDELFLSDGSHSAVLVINADIPDDAPVPTSKKKKTPPTA